jgi:hypothetical protein
LFDSHLAWQRNWRPAIAAVSGHIGKRNASANVAGMKSKKNQKGSVTGPLIKQLVDRQKSDFKAEKPDFKTSMTTPFVESTPLAQPDLYQDPGQGYNFNFTFPQD